jgi:hypothetical protein
MLIKINVLPSEGEDEGVYPLEQLKVFRASEHSIINVVFRFGEYEQPGYAGYKFEELDWRSWFNLEFSSTPKRTNTFETDSRFMEIIKIRQDNKKKFFVRKMYTVSEFLNLPKFKTINDVKKYFYFLDDYGKITRTQYCDKYIEIAKNTEKLREYWENSYWPLHDEYYITPCFRKEDSNSLDIENTFNELTYLCEMLKIGNFDHQFKIFTPEIDEYRYEMNKEFEAKIAAEIAEDIFNNSLSDEDAWAEMGRNEERQMDW